MRGLNLLIALMPLSVIGCASKPDTTQTAASQPVLPIAEASSEAICSALMFDPPVTMNDFPPDLSREQREPSAFVGWQSQTTTFSYIRIDDWQPIGFWGQSGRRATVTSFSTITR